LVEAGLATLTGSDVRFTDPAREWPDVQRLRADAIAQYPRMTPVFDLLDTCAGNYHLALTGDVPALGLLFGDGAEVFERAVANIREHSDIPLCQTLVRDLLSRLLDGDRAGTLRVLEIGGGEGLLTRDLLPLCDGRDVEYHFTDIGRAFVLGAERDARSRGLNFARFDTLDISRPPEQQGFAAGTYDVVFAFNVLHATRSVAESLANAKSLLAPGGLLVLQESIRPARWVDFVWGLTDGWWTFEDTPLRQTSPLMGLDSWVESLRGAGFESVASFPQSGNRRVSSDAGVVIARRPSNASGDAHRLSSIEKLKEMGAQVEVVTADVADRAQMQVALDRALARFGRIDGVVHSALVLDDATIQSKTRESAERVLAPKIAGTRVLEELCTGLDLDFFVMFSSLVSLLGGAGQIDYCAASNFQDAFAHATHSKLAKSVISIDWGAWREVGKAFRSAVERGIPSHEALPDGMSPSEGLDAFMRVLSSPFPQVLVSPVDPCVLMKRRAVSAAGRPAASRRPAEPVEVAEAPRNETERVIADIWCDVLGVDRIGVEDNFFDLGGDSVISLQFIAKAKKAGLRFTNRQVFEHQTIAGLAAIAAESAGHALSKEVGS
jgi:SAM-dependent methyltransferase/aryl carrier-like protein